MTRFTATQKAKLEVTQFSSGLAIPGALRKNFKEKLYHKLGLKSLENKIVQENLLAI